MAINAPTATSPCAPTAVNDDSTFKATDRQWASLKLQKIADGVFQDAAVTDGKIALDDELVTPVFSPYSGRVTKLIARPGDDVARGDPLFAVEASELAQGQNDLVSAASARNLPSRSMMFGPISPPLPSPPWQRPQRSSKAFRPGSFAPSGG